MEELLIVQENRKIPKTEETLSFGNKWFWLGAGVCLLLYIPILVLNVDMRAIYHDEFDGELLSYILQARHLMDEELPELFCGTPKTAMTPPAPALVLLYRILSPKWSFFVSYVAIAILSFAGMYITAYELTKEGWIASLTAVLFSILPFYPVYGLSVMGQPLLLAAFMKMRTNRLFAYLVIAFFVLNSSLVLVGYADIIIVSLLVVYMIVKKNHYTARYALGWAEMVLGYAVMNLTLVRDILFPDGSFQSHRTELVATASSPAINFMETISKGIYHAASDHQYILIFSLLTVAYGFFRFSKFSKTTKKQFGYMCGLLCCTVAIAVLRAFFNWNPIVNVRNSIGGPLLFFQIDRFTWLYPALWYMIMALSLVIISESVDIKSLKIIILTSFVVSCTIFVWNDSTIKENTKAFMDGRYASQGYASVEEFFQPGLFSKAEKVIGREKQQYRVCSIGLYPSIALYNGFNCVDGYSNNYPAEYKHSFRKVIAKELSKDDNLKRYYDNWGNRCYVFSSEIGKHYYIPKTAKMSIKNLEVDFKSLREMKCEYLFSSVPVYNCNDIKLLSRLHDDESVYDVYVYKISEDT